MQFKQINDHYNLPNNKNFMDKSFKELFKHILLEKKQCRQPVFVS